jgi:hypothetical protein
MLGVTLDAGVMYGVIALITGETPDFLTALFVSLGFAIGLALCFGFLGLVGGLIAVVPVVGLFGAILSMLYGMPLTRAIAGSAGFLAYKIAISLFWVVLFR